MKKLGSGDIGPMVRRIRLSENLSLAKLAGLTGLSQSFLSQLERGLTNPSIVSLRKIADALGCPLGTFFPDMVPSEGPVVRKNERKVLKNTESSLTYHLVSQVNEHRVQLLITMLEPGAANAKEPLKHGGDEAGLVLQGSCSMQLGDETWDLNEGDAIFIRENTKHKFTNTSDTILIFISAISPPVF